MTDKKRIALLIDCDNVSHKSIEGVLENLAQHGMVNVRHAHGDWSSPNMSGWIEKLQPHAIKPIQQFAYTKKKNATDTSIIIEAMEFLLSNKVDAFALMSSDCDFTPLATHILEYGMPVYGFGNKNTPQAFIKACTPFIYIENLVSETAKEQTADSEDKPSIKISIKKDRSTLRKDADLVRLLRTAFEQTAGDDGWANLSRVANYISNNNSSFSSVNYGYKKLGDLILVSDLFKIEMRNNGTVMYIKDRREKSDGAAVA